jgi:hypothetical protein
MRQNQLNTYTPSIYIHILAQGAAQHLDPLLPGMGAMMQYLSTILSVTLQQVPLMRGLAVVAYALCFHGGCALIGC